MKQEKEWIGVALDGVLARWDGWQGITHIGPPVLDMVRRVKNWIASGERVKIFTDRVSGPFIPHTVEFSIQLWCIDNLGHVLEITCQKDHLMKELWDDRCVHVEQNTGKILG